MAGKIKNFMRRWRMFYVFRSNIYYKRKEPDPAG